MRPSSGHSSLHTGEHHPQGALESRSRLLMIMTLASRMLGLVRIRVMSSLMGATATGDIFFFTFNLANNSRKLLAEGALSSAYIPAYAQLAHEDPQRADRFFLQTALLLTCFILVLAGVLFFTAPSLLHTISQLDTQLISRYAAPLLGVFSLYLLGIMLTSQCSGTLQVHGRFFLPSLAPLVVSVSVIMMSLFFYPRYGVTSIAWGFALGALIPAVLMMLYIKPSASLSWKGSREGITTLLLSRWGMLTLFSAILFIGQQISFYLASTLEEGSVMIFSNALMIWQLPFGIFFVSIASSLYPELSQLYAQKDLHAARERISRSAGYIFALLIPSGMLLWLFSQEMAQLILLSGRYDAASVARTAELLRYLAPALPAAGITQLFMRDLYIRSAWKTAFLRTVLVTAIDVGGSILLIRTALGLAGLPAAYSAAALTLACISLVRFSPDRGMVRSWLKILGSAAAGGALMVLLRGIISPWQASWLSLAAYIFVISAAGTALLLVLYHAAGVHLLILRRNPPSQSE